VILNSVVSFTLSHQEIYANEVLLPVYYILMSDTHIHVWMQCHHTYFEKKIVRDNEKSVTFN
jgi:hypothetical protein